MESKIMAIAPHPEPRELTEEEWDELVDKQARRYLGMSGREFAERWAAGEFAADADRREVMRVASLLPLGG